MAGCGAYAVRAEKGRRVIGAEREIDLGIGSERWTSLVLELGAFKPADIDLIHVTDREGDCFERMVELHAAGEQLVVRAAHDRVIEEDEERLSALLAGKPVIAKRVGWIGARRRSEIGARPRR